ncbi:deleted in malignant brain tumors 1 protein-like isoform X2 [Epinephelus fuscoguttatus]|uniref:deleted in malignant brain tumors 1 protein-like isoform X2 n=1 Tax=Epinephelus fuscoguttatus TaxID=293821 RepID=UPI0020D041B4|nr:deleted in malignant brain tumors 1 protein-like isoform X2 [Epinephelus fuscoguttatus]
MSRFTMWTLLVLCSVIVLHGVQGVDRLGTTKAMYRPTGPADPNCVSRLLGRTGALASKNYPNPYPNSKTCIWYITPSSGIVELSFRALSIEYHPTCDYDALFIFDGPYTSSRLLGKLCGTNSTTFRSTGPAMTLQFTTDRDTSSSGFYAEFRAKGGTSCRNSCGYWLGNCSCSSSCEQRGNCCPNFKDYCAFSPTYTTTPSVSYQPSCRYNCGGHLGSCSCTSSCQYYGNCCHDYSYYCPATTEGPITPRPSCYNNCGGHMGSCSCRSSCQSYGNCCYDYYTTCLPTTTGIPIRPTSSDGYSCRNNCGSYLAACSCVSTCRSQGNCCYDFYSHCYTTIPATTAQPSCRYNCGRHMGSCSCASSCQWNGNCCYDYYSQCFTTTGAPPTTAQPSCRYNCGRHMGSCSCASSCLWNGNCCYDYYSYCYYTTWSPATASAQPCGDSLYGSGTFSSPNHPNHYQDNAYCVWQLRAAYDQRIFLAFTYLQLENCCNCDYIAVYDGPSVSSRYLGKVCNSSLISFYSTSNYLTVLFRTDGSVVGRGFNADFISSLPPSSGQVDCSSDNMNIVIQRSYLNSLGYDGHSLYVNDQHCRPQVSSYQVVFSFPINSCGTIRKFENGRVVYTNALRAYASSSGEITRQSHLKMNVGCRMEQDSVSQIMYVVHHNGNSSIVGTGRFNTTMDFYTSSSFYYKVHQVPYEVTLNQNMYVQVSLRRGDSSLVLFLDTCVTSPSPHDFYSRPYYLVRNGCGMDSTYWAYSSGTRPYAQFTFRAFQFLRATESVYIQCKVVICQANDYSSRCRRGCMRRTARDLGSEHDSQTLVLGPIQLKDPEKKEEETPKQDKA